MPITTTYDVVTRYMVQNSGAPVVQQMTQQVHQLERATSSSMGLWSRLGGVMAGAFGFYQGKKALIDFNSTMEQSKIQMAGLMAQAGRGSFTSNLETAATLVRQMQIDARASVGTTADFVRMASMLVQPLTMAGASMETLRDMTKQSVVASQSMGIAAEVAARDVDQAIRGQYHAVDQFSSKLLTPLGYGGEEGRTKFNRLSMPQRLAEYQRALGAPAISAMAGAQETSSAGAMSTFVDTVQMTLGKVGLPLFVGTTKEVQRWNEWLTKNQARVDHIAETVGHKLLQAAVSFRDAIAFAAKHWDQILVTWGALKAAGYLAGAGGVAGAASGIAGAGGFGAKAAAVSIVASAVYIGATELARWLEERKTEQIASGARVGEGSVGLFQGAMTNATQAKAFKQMMMSSGLASESGLNTSAFASALGDSSIQQRQQWAKALGMPMHQGTGWRDLESNPQLIAEAMAKSFAGILKDEMVNGLLTEGTGFPRLPFLNDTKVPRPEKPKINVTINRIEVASDDPDRFVFGMVNALRRAAKNPSGIGPGLRALREG